MKHRIRRKKKGCKSAQTEDILHSEKMYFNKVQQDCRNFKTEKTFYLCCKMLESQDVSVRFRLTMIGANLWPSLLW